MASSEVRFHRELAAKCRDLVRLTDELRQRLSDLAWECEDRARMADSLIEGPRAEKRVSADLAAKEGIEPLTLSIRDAAGLLGLGRSTIYRLIGEGQLQTVKIGNRTLIKMASIRSLVENPM